MSFNYKKNNDDSLLIEDPIHGKIVVPYPFSKIVESVEMKRLSGINQTGFAQYEYKDLVNNDRLSHSVGSFYIMSLILDKLEKDLKYYNISISKDDRDIALCSMLLHDIGHGPFSHSLENITNYSHEKRTTDILIGNTEVGNLLRELYGKDKVNQIASFIAEVNTSENINTDSFTKLLKNLVSHQLDADRLDYLIRDSYYVGVPSSIDLNRLINNLSVIVNNNQEYELLINRKGLSSIENVLIHRYQMYRDVYLGSVSVLGDVVFKRIMDRYRNNSNLKSVPVSENFRILASDPSITNLSDFVKMKDSDFISSFDSLKNNTIDPVEAYLCDFSHLSDYILLQNEIDVDKIKEKLLDIFGVIPDETLSIIKIKTKNKLYKSEQRLNIQDGNKIVDITDCTNLIRPQERFENSFTYFNPELLRIELGLSNEKFKKYEGDVNRMIKELNKKPEEFELKYIVDDESDEMLLSRIIKTFTDNGYSISSTSKKHNNDDYYDTNDLSLYLSKGSLRIRTSNEDGKTKYRATYKLPSREGTVYTSRTEMEESLSDPSFDTFASTMSSKEVPVDFTKVVKTPLLNSSNNRTDTVLVKDGVEVCLSFDDVKYTSHVLDETVCRDRMIEIEATGHLNDRIALNNIHEFISSSIKGITVNKQSKYERGFNCTFQKYKDLNSDEKDIMSILQMKLNK